MMNEHFSISGGGRVLRVVRGAVAVVARRSKDKDALLADGSGGGA